MSSFKRGSDDDEEGRRRSKCRKRMLINVMDQERRENAREPKYNLCVCGQ